jgi:dsDNA-binding SOS-regulon protein
LDGRKLNQLQKLKESLYGLIERANQDPFVEQEEIDRYFDMLNVANLMIETLNKLKNKQ